MTHQEAFNKVRTHLLTQRTKSKDTSICRYRGPRGLRCAIGCLIPDDQYREIFDSGTLPLSEVMSKVPALQGLKLNFLTGLQRIHDNGAVSFWERDLEEFYQLWKYRGLLT